MAKQGWIALHRKIKDHWLWEEKPFDKAHAWVDMLLLANHEDNKFLLGNELVEVKSGSFITSEIKLMERWGWGKTKTRAFLDLLQSDGMIIKKSDRKKTTITIVKYGDYAVLKTIDKPQTDREQTDSRPQADTNNNENNENNENNIKKERKAAPPANSYEKILSVVSDDSLRATYFSYIQMRKMIRSPISNKGLETLIKRVDFLEPQSVERKKKMLETAILNNWKNVYPLKEEKIPEKPSYDKEAFKKWLNSQY